MNTQETIQNYLKTNPFNLEILLEISKNPNKFDINMQDMYGRTPLIACIREIQTEVINSRPIGQYLDICKIYLAQPSINVNLQDKDGVTALIEASYSSIHTITPFEYLLTYVPNLYLNLLNISNEGVLYNLGTGFSTIEALKLFLEQPNIDVNIRNSDGLTTLMALCGNCNVDMFLERIILLLSHPHINVNLTSTRYGNLTALMLAFECSHLTSSPEILIEVINAFLTHPNFDISVKDEEGKTTYDYAIQYISNTEILTRLNPQHTTIQTSTQPSILSITLPTKPVYIDTSIIVEHFDLLSAETNHILISDYIKEPDNIVIMYNENQYFLTKRSTIMEQRSSAIVYPCKTPNTMHPTNIIKDQPLYNLRQIGLIVNAGKCDMKQFFENPNLQLFGLIQTEHSYPSYVSDNILNHQGSQVSGLHCQSDQKDNISFLIKAKVLQAPLRRSKRRRRETTRMFGGKKKRSTYKYKTKPRKYKRKTRKHKNSS